MDTLTFAEVDTSAVFLTIAIVEVLKQAGLPSRYGMLASVGVGLVIALIVTAVNLWPGLRPWWLAVVAGVQIGLMASGTYSGVKALAEKVTGQEPS